MNQLTPRLKMIKEGINRGETMADIGTDHGFLPVFLLNEGICPKAILIDISGPSLEKAKNNKREYLKRGQMDFRIGDGLKPLSLGEVDVVVLAGMGGLLMTKILEEDQEKSRSIDKFIFQPRNNCGTVRRWLKENSYAIKEETLVREGKYICEVIVATREGIGKPYPLEGKRDIAFEIPFWYSERKDNLMKEYLQRKLEKEQDILRGQEKSQKRKTEEVERNIEYLKSLQRIQENEK